METNNNSKRIHPLVAAAAVGVLLVSLVGVAAMTGMLPSSNSEGSKKEAIAALEKEAADKAADAKEAERKASLARKESDSRQAAEKKAASQERSREASQERYRESSTKVAQAQICYDCGRIESVRSVQTQAKPSGVGVVGGAVVGGLLGNQIGGGSGKTLATVAGAVGGGFAGNEIEKRTRTEANYEVTVRMEDGRTRTFPYDNQPNWNTGDRVRVVDGYLRAR